MMKVLGSSALPPTVSSARLLHNKSDRAFRQMMYDLTVVSNHVERVRGYFAGSLEITPPQFALLMAVGHLGGTDGVEIGRIAQHLHVSPAFVTMEVQKLKKRKLVNKLPNPKDQRSILVCLSSSARKIISDLSPVIREINEHFFGVMTKEEFLIFSKVARKLVISGEETVQLASRLLGNEQSRGRVASNNRP